MYAESRLQIAEACRINFKPFTTKDTKKHEGSNHKQENLRAPSCPLWFKPFANKNAQLRRLRVQKLCFSFYRPKYLAFLSAYSFHFSGRSSKAKMADTGHTGTHAPQSMHSTGSMNSMLEPSNWGSSFLGWMQSTGHASTQAASLVPMQGSAITYAIEVKISVSQ